MKKTGIDLSSHQQTVDWEKVTADFAIIRAGWSWYNGGMDIDTHFLANVAGAQKAGIPWGVYLYAYDLTPDAAEVSANKLADLLDQYQIPYPVAYDFEYKQYVSGQITPDKIAENTAICQAFLSVLQGRGYYAMLYTYTNLAKNYLDMAALSAYDLWIADYSKILGWTGPYGMWQYSGSGTAPGFSTAVDLDYAYKDYPSIIRAAGLNGYGKKSEAEEIAALRAENQALRKQVQRQTAQLEAAQKKLDDIRKIVEE